MRQITRNHLTHGRTRTLELLVGDRAHTAVYDELPAALYTDPAFSLE